MISVFRGCSSGNSRSISRAEQHICRIPDCSTTRIARTAQLSAASTLSMHTCHGLSNAGYRVSWNLEGKGAFSTCSSMVRDLVDSPCGFVLTYGRSTVSLYIYHFSSRLFEAALVSNVRHPISERVSNKAMILDSIAEFTTRA
jgi:hypothetical protein